MGITKVFIMEYYKGCCKDYREYIYKNIEHTSVTNTRTHTNLNIHTNLRTLTYTYTPTYAH